MPTECCQETWEKIPNDEPVFILRGKDLLVPVIVEEWIDAARHNNVDSDKIERAEQHLRDIIEFQSAYPERCKIPD